MWLLSGLVCLSMGLEQLKQRLPLVALLLAMQLEPQLVQRLRQGQEQQQL